jgi:hypothetical protein
MNQELLQRLDALAAKLGVASEKIWDVLVYQGHVAGIVGAVVAGISVIGFYATYKLAKKYDGYDEGPIIFAVVVVCISILLLIIGIYNALYLLNPEYYAVEKLLGS